MVQGLPASRRQVVKLFGAGAGVFAAVMLAGGATGAFQPDVRSASGVRGGGDDMLVQQAATSPWTCGPVNGMNVLNGHLKPAHSQMSARPHGFYLARAIYSGGGRGGFGGFGGGGRGGNSWAIDYPTADRVMTRIATRLSNLDACEWETPLSLADPDLRRHPFLYTVEWGRANLTEQEVDGLRGYLLAGGFLMIDDFWGTEEWRTFEAQMRRVLPEHAIVDVPRDHAIFRAYYEIDEDIVQVPNIGNGRAVGRGIPGARTWERDGYEAQLRGIFDESGRLIVAINWNTDLGDALEWAESPEYPLVFSTFASRLFLNLIIYAMAY